MKVLMIDNYDSFTWNLVHLFEELGADVAVYRNDAISVEDAGVSLELIRALGRHVPTLGVCLGHQAIVEAFGGSVGSARSLLHGKASVIHHDGEGVFAGLPEEIEVGRYHSLAATEVPEELVVTARTDGDEVMGVRHLTLRIEGVQFHPESILSEHGHALFENFLKQTKSA